MEERMNEATRNRPEGDRVIDAPMVEIDLNKYIQQLKSEEAWLNSQRNAITLFKTDAMRIVMIGLHAGGTLPEHKAEGIISVHVLKGHIRFRVGDEEKKLVEGNIVTLHERIPHSVTGVEESVFLLTMALKNRLASHQSSKHMAPQAGIYHTLKVVKHVDFGIYLDGGDVEILMPKRFVPAGVQDGDEIEVFIYHDNEGRLIATNQKPYGTVGQVALLQARDKNNQGAFLDWGLMKDIFLPLSQQKSAVRAGGKYLVYIYLDEMTGRVAATEHISRFLDNDTLTVKEGDEVDMVIWRETDIGYSVIINNKHEGLLHYNEVFKELNPGDIEKGYVKSILEDNKITVSLGKKGYKRIETEAEKIMRLLDENNGYLPYHDKSDPEEIYEFFGMSKKAFKMAVGALYKQRKISFTKTGIKQEGD